MNDFQNQSNAKCNRRRALGIAGVGAMAFVAMPGKRQAVASQTASASPSAELDAAWAEFDAQLAAVSPSVAMLATEIVDGELQAVHAYEPTLVLPVGSSFKLWILGGLSKLVESGEATWDQEVLIDDRYRSVPGGDLRYVEAGTSFTIRYLAERMIQKSDNTATDHVFHFVGRERVEEAMVEMGHHDPSLNMPLFATREMVMLKFATTLEEREAYLAASVDERRRILTEEIANIPYEALADLEQTAPLEIDRIEWFANREDLARTMLWLHLQAQKPGLRPVAEILSLETQLHFEGERWPYVGFKGGSEMGVLSGTWLMERADGRQFVYSIGFRDLEADINVPAAVSVMELGRDILAEV
jgi:hypothetical protein